MNFRKKFKMQAPFCATHMIGMGRIKREQRFVLGFVAVIRTSYGTKKKREFSLFEFRNYQNTSYQWLLMGSSVGTPKYFEKENKLWVWTNPGIKLLQQENPDTFIDVNTPDFRFSSNCYYRGVPGKSYRVIINLHALTGGQKLKIEMTCYDSLGNELTRLAGEERILEKGDKEITEVFKIPELPGYQIIYNDTSFDQMVQISAKGRFTRMKDDILLKKFALMEDMETNKMVKSEIVLNGMTYSCSNELKDGEIKQFVPQGCIYKIYILFHE